MFCGTCGSAIPEGYAYCTKCGSAVPQSPATPKPSISSEHGGQRTGSPKSTPLGGSESRGAKRPWYIDAVIVSLGMTILVGVPFAMSYAVFEWRHNESAYIECVTRVQEKYLDLWEAHMDDKPISPDSPTSSASDAAWNTYFRQFDRYEKDFGVWADKKNDLDRDWIDETRAC